MSVEIPENLPKSQVKPGKTRNRKPLAKRSILHQAQRVKNLVQQCGDVERQKQVLELVSQAIEGESEVA